MSGDEAPQQPAAELEAGMSALRTSNSTLQKLNAIFEGTMKKQRERIAFLEQAAKEHRHTNTALREENSALRDKCGELERTAMDLRDTNSALQQGKNALERVLEEVLAASLDEAEESAVAVVFVRAWRPAGPTTAKITPRSATVVTAASSLHGLAAGSSSGAGGPCPRRRAMLSEELIQAAKLGHVGEMHRLLAEGADAQYNNEYAETAAHRAAYHGHLEALRVLLDRGAAADAADRRGNRALHWAALNGNASCVHALTAAGADADAQDKYGWAPLHYAAYHGHEMAVRALMQAGANRYSRNNDGKMPRKLARSKVIRALLS